MKGYALISVYDKNNVEPLARGLMESDYRLVSTGQTALILRQKGLTCKDVAELTGQEELFSGRVKTLHPAIHGGILARRDCKEDLQTLEKANFPLIDVVVVNLYPFKAKTSENVSLAEALEFIDIGGVTLLRAAAKNYKDVAVLVDPVDYNDFISKIETQNLTEKDRLYLAHKAFEHTAKYEQSIAEYFKKLTFSDSEQDLFPTNLNLSATKVRSLRYGENPHQKAALYQKNNTPPLGLLNAEQKSGKMLSYNNLLDGEAALNLAAEFSEPVCAVIKHNNPCGVGSGLNIAESIKKALEADPLSAYGSVIAVNRNITLQEADLIVNTAGFVEVLIVPEIEDEAIQVLSRRWKNLRILATKEVPNNKVNSMEIKDIKGGFLLQEKDYAPLKEEEFEIVTQRKPSQKEWAEMLFAWKVCKHVKSNAIVLAQGGMTVGVGAGQMSRVEACRIAVDKAQKRARGAVLASDAMIPFVDTLEVAAAAGVKWIIQSGGSIRDQDLITLADQLGLTMVFTKMRHFRH